MDIFDFIRRDERIRGLFAGMPDEELSYIRVRRFRKGEYVFRAGEAPYALYIVLSGIAAIERDADGMPGQMHDHLGFLDIVGFFELIRDVPRLTSVRAYRQLLVAEIPRTAILRWEDMYPRFLLRIGTKIIERLYGEIAKINECAKYPAYYGLVSTILGGRAFFNREDPEYTGPVKIDYTRQMLAHVIGKDVRSVNRVLKELKERQIVTVEHGKIYVDERQARALQEEKNKYIECAN